MGFKIDEIKLENGIIVKNVYVKITGVSGNKDNLRLDFGYFSSQEISKQLGMTGSLFQVVTSFKPDQHFNALRWDKQGYRHAKQLPEFKDAIDVLEAEQTV